MPPRTDSPIRAGIGRPGRFRVRALRGSQALSEVADETVDGDAVLAHGVSLPDGHLAVLERVEVHGYAERRADLVLASVPPADRAGVVVVAHPQRLH